MEKLFEYTPAILLTILAVTFMVGSGYLITVTTSYKQEIEKLTHCIAADMEYIDRDCVKPS
jgi:hypothetical protein